MTLSEDVMLAIESAAIICEKGDVPESCREICTLIMPRLALELDKYQSGDDESRQPNGSPTPSFWVAARHLAKARIDADQTMSPVLEPVSFLLKSGVTHDQIAFHIYGHRGEGPFVSGNGIANVALIEQEAANPGSVIPKDWVHPSKYAAVAAKKKELEAKLEAYKILEAGPKRNTDPATVEQMLQDGCYIQVIQKYKGVTREEVLKAAAKLGIEPKEQPGAAEVKPLVPQALQTLSEVEVDGVTPTDGIKEASATPTRGKPGRKPGQKAKSRIDADSAAAIDDFTRAAIVASYEGEPKGAAEIADELRKEGHTVNANQVSDVLRLHRQEQKSEGVTA